MQSLVYELDKKVHALELSDAAHKLDIAYAKGEIAGIRSSTATSFEVKAASDLTNERIEGIRKEVAGIKSVLLWCAAAIVTAVLGAFKFGLVVAP